MDYIRVTVDERDRRVKHLYLTEKGIPAAQKIKQVHAGFYDVISGEISPDELRLTEKTLKKMADNINQRVWHRMEADHGEQR